MDNSMPMYETVSKLAELAPHDCAAAAQTVSPDQPALEPPSSDADLETPGTLNAVTTARQVRMASDIRSQRAEIIAHREQMIRELGRAVSLDEAARDWIPRNAQAWRSRNGTVPCESALDS